MGTTLTTKGIPYLPAYLTDPHRRSPLATDPVLCLDAFIVALNQASDAGKWYTSTMQLQLISVAFCEACRNVPMLHLAVEFDTPRCLWDSSHDDEGTTAGESGRNATKTGRVAPFRARELTWKLPASMLNIASGTVVNVESFIFDDKLTDRVDEIVWPNGLKRLVFGERFNNSSLDNVAWPPSLQQLTFKLCFDQPIDDIRWPVSLQQLVFGTSFNQRIDATSWPPSLRSLTFGIHFDQPVHAVKWPPSLTSLTFGDWFSQPIDEVEWPASLKFLTFGDWFNNSLRGVVWPSSLTGITFGRRFNQLIDDVQWPPNLQQLTLGRAFQQHLANQSALFPSSLKRLTIPVRRGESIPELPGVEVCTIWRSFW